MLVSPYAEYLAELDEDERTYRYGGNMMPLCLPILESLLCWRTRKVRKETDF